MGRHATTAVTLGVLVMLCFVGLVVGFRQLTADLPDEPLVSAPPPCTPTPVEQGDVVQPPDVLVSVFNGGNRSGQANRTMRELVERGFVEGESGNAPGRTKKVDRAQVWLFGDPVNPAARLVAQQFGPNTKIKPKGQREPFGSGVVVVVGNDLQALGPRVAEVRAESDSEICTPPEA